MSIVGTQGKPIDVDLFVHNAIYGKANKQKPNQQKLVQNLIETSELLQEQELEIKRLNSALTKYAWRIIDLQDKVEASQK